MPLQLKLTIRDAEYLIEPNTGERVFHVRDSHALIQAVGYLKYLFGARRQAIYFRGHTRLYGGLRPSLYRGINTHKAQGNREYALKKAITELRGKNPLLNKIYIEAQEPLLQHYGLNTSSGRSCR